MKDGMSVRQAKEQLPSNWIFHDKRAMRQHCVTLVCCDQSGLQMVVQHLFYIINQKADVLLKRKEPIYATQSSSFLLQLGMSPKRFMNDGNLCHSMNTGETMQQAPAKQWPRNPSGWTRETSLNTT